VDTAKRDGMYGGSDERESKSEAIKASPTEGAVWEKRVVTREKRAKSSNVV